MMRLTVRSLLFLSLGMSKGGAGTGLVVIILVAELASTCLLVTILVNEGLGAASAGLFVLSLGCSPLGLLLVLYFFLTLGPELALDVDIYVV